MKRYFAVSMILLWMVFPFTFSQQAPDLPPPSSELIRQGINFHDEGKYREAIENYEKISPNDPMYSLACYEIALSLYSLSDYEAALEKCRDAISYGYQEAAVYSLMGSLYDDMGDPGKGIEVLTDALEKWPYNQNLYYNLGLCYLNSSQPDVAEEIFLQSISLKPYHAKSHMALARANYRMNRIARSYLAFIMGILINPDIEYIREYEAAVSGKADSLLQPVKYRDNNNANHLKWDELRWYLQSEMAFDDKFEYDYDVSYISSRQALMLFRKMSYEPNDSSLYNQLYVRFFADMMERDDFETFLNYFYMNTGNEIVKEWTEKNGEKIDNFILWAQETIDRISGFAYSYRNEQEGRRMMHFDDNSVLTAVGALTGDGEGIKEGEWIYLNPDGSISEKGRYENNHAEGEYFLYHSNGNIKQQLQLEKDELNGTSLTYYSDGSLQGKHEFRNGVRHGKTTTYTGAGKIASVTNYVEGKAEGPAEYYNFNEGFVQKFSYKDDKAEGNLEEYWINGKKRLECSYSGGEYDGDYHAWYSNGILQSQASYVKGERNGKWTEYHPNGKISQIAEYLDDQLTGEARYFDRNGDLIAVESGYEEGLLNGQRIDYTIEGRKLAEQNFRQGRIVSLDCYGEDEEIIYHADEKDSMLYFKFFYPDGVLKREGWTRSGKEHGEWKIYNPNGVLITRNSYDNGMLSGRQVNYFLSGKIKEEYSCDSNKIQGSYREYFPDGSLKVQGWYDKDLLTGLWKTYHSNDSLASASFYEENQLAGYAVEYTPSGMKMLGKFFDEEYVQVKEVVYDHEGNAPGNIELTYKESIHEIAYPNGQVRERRKYAGHYQDDWMEGWYPNGTVRTRVHFIDGNIVDTLRAWDYKGNLKLELPYSVSQANGMCKWYEDGHIDFEAYIEQGIYQDTAVSYYDNGHIYSSGTLKDDERHGRYFYYSNDGQLIYCLNYYEGSIKSYSYLGNDGKMLPEIPVDSSAMVLKSYFSNGKLSAEAEMKNGTFHGEYKVYYPDGKLSLKQTYYYGNDEGVVEVRHPNRKLKYSVNYHNDERNGHYLSFHENGQKFREGKYMAGLKEGEWIIYDKNGKEQERLFYFNGEVYEIR